jgi:hypothetical protein
LQQLTAQQDDQHDHDNNSLVRHSVSVVSVVMDAPPSLDRCVFAFAQAHGQEKLGDLSR